MGTNRKPTDAAPKRPPPSRAVMVDDATWQQIVRLLPTKPRRRRYPGRLPIPDRVVLDGILTVLQLGIPWENLSAEVPDSPSGMTCWRRLAEWQRTGVWPQVEAVLKARLPAMPEVNWDRVLRIGHRGSSRPNSP